MLALNDTAACPKLRLVYTGTILLLISLLGDDAAPALVATPANYLLLAGVQLGDSKSIGAGLRPTGEGCFGRHRGGGGYVHFLATARPDDPHGR